MGAALRALPDREYRLPYYRGDQTLEAAPIRGQFRFKNGVVVIDDCVANRRNRAERAQCLRWKHRARNLKILMRALHPHPPIGVEQDIFSAMVFKAASDQRPELPDQLFVAAFGDLLKFLHRVLPVHAVNLSKFTLLYTNQWYYTYSLVITRGRYYARTVRLSRSKNK